MADGQQICLPVFYFGLLIVALIALVGSVVFQYSLGWLEKIRPGGRVMGGTSREDSRMRGDMGGAGGMGVPMVNPDVVDDLAVGELPPVRRDYRKFQDPLKEPTRRYVGYPHEVRFPEFGWRNHPTQGVFPSYQMMGYLKKKGKKKDPERMLKLYGRRTDTYKYEYYVIHHEDPELKIPLERRGDQELYDGDLIKVPGYPGEYQVSLYDFEAPRYVPYRF